jgi:plastocyanin
VVIPATASGSSRATVALRHMAFTPSSLRVKRGATVTFVWKDGSIPHNVTFKGFRSKTKTSGSYSVHLVRAGTYTYRCTLHPGMKGRITVS